MGGPETTRGAGRGSVAEGRGAGFLLATEAHGSGANNRTTIPLGDDAQLNFRQVQRQGRQLVEAPSAVAGLVEPAPVFSGLLLTAGTLTGGLPARPMPDPPPGPPAGPVTVQTKWGQKLISPGEVIKFRSPPAYQPSFFPPGGKTLFQVITVERTPADTYRVTVQTRGYLTTAANPFIPVPLLPDTRQDRTGLSADQVNQVLSKYLTLTSPRGPDAQSQGGKIGQGAGQGGQPRAGGLAGQPTDC